MELFAVVIASTEVVGRAALVMCRQGGPLIAETL